MTQRFQQAAPAHKEEKAAPPTAAELPKPELQKMIDTLEREMKAAAKSLEFEKAAVLRDQLLELRQIMVLKDGEQEDPSLRLVVQNASRRPRPHP